MAGDWIKVHRKIADSQVFSDEGVLRLWIYLLCRANYKASYFRGRRIEVGQVAFSYRSLADTLGCSPATLVRRIDKLQDWGNLVVKAEREFTVVTICNWSTYQSYDDDARNADETPVKHQRNTNEYTNEYVPKKERREEVKEGKKTPDSSEPALPASEPPVLDFPTVGKSKTWNLLPSHVATLREAFPKLDIEGECRKARGWCIANEAKRKTPGGMYRFLFSWMERNQNRGSTQTPAVTGRVLTRNGTEIISDRELFDEP